MWVSLMEKRFQLLLPTFGSHPRVPGPHRGSGAGRPLADSDQPVRPQHYAFLVEESDFDAILDRIRGRGLTYWADPNRARPGPARRGPARSAATNGGHGVYWEEPSGHFLEIITRPYGSGG